MKFRWLAALAAVTLVALGFWLVAGSSSVEGGPADDAGILAGRAASGADAIGGVGARETSSAKDRISGRVVGEDGQPVTEGSITLSCLDSDPPGRLLPGAGLRLDEDGKFEGAGCRGRVCVRFRHPSMVPAESWVLKAGRPEVLRARMLGRLEGTVRGPDGEPVENASLIMVPPPGDEDPTALPPFVSRNASTDADGGFWFARLERPPCDPCGDAAGRCDPAQDADMPTYSRMLLTAQAEGFRVAETLVDANSESAVEVVLVESAAPLRVTLVDPTGQPYPRARVIARSQSRAYEQHAAQAETSALEFDGLGDGLYDLRAIQDGIELVVREGAAAGETVDLVGTVAANGPDLEVRVLDGEGRPMVGMVVDGGPLVGARTDATGTARASNVMPGPYTLRIRGVGVRAFSRRVSVPESDVSIRLEVRAD